MLLTTALAFTLAMSHSYAAVSDDIDPPAVPANLAVPAGFKPFLIGHAYGTQNYVCLPSASGVAWTFFAPQATLIDDEGEQLITHFLSPNPAENGTPRATWQSRDTSRVWAAAIQTSTDANYVAPGAIPWLLLQYLGAQYGPTGGDRMIETRYIQRVNTSGGLAPAAGCSVTTDVGRKALMPYTSDYIFYKKK
jgi:hypothetical protein